MWRAVIFFGCAASAALAPPPLPELTPAALPSPLEDGDAVVAGAGGLAGLEAEAATDGVGAAKGEAEAEAEAAAVVVATPAPSEAAGRGYVSAPPQAIALARASGASEARRNCGRIGLRLYFLMSTSSTSNWSVEFGGMTLPIPWSP
jgi:hypothetical protein